MGPLWNSTWAFIPSLTGGPTGPPIGAPPQYDFRGGGSVCYGNCLPLNLLVFASKLPPPLRPPYQTPNRFEALLLRGVQTHWPLRPLYLQPHQLFGKGNRLYGGRSQVCSSERSQLQTWERSELPRSELYTIYNFASSRCVE